MYIKTTLQTPRKHYYYHKIVLAINIFLTFVAVDQVNKRKGKYIITACTDKLL